MDQVTIKDFYRDHINKVLYSIFNNQTLINWAENGGAVEPDQVEKAKVSIEKDEKWLAYLKSKLDELNN